MNEKVGCLIIHGFAGTVQHRSAEYIFSEVEADIKEIRYYKNSGHVICLSVDRPELFKDIEQFLIKVLDL